jgi:hypothetical protein
MPTIKFTSRTCEGLRPADRQLVQQRGERRRKQRLELERRMRKMPQVDENHLRGVCSRVRRRTGRVEDERTLADTGFTMNDDCRARRRTP